MAYDHRQSSSLVFPMGHSDGGFCFCFFERGGGNGVVILVSHGQLDCHQHIAGRTNLPPLNIYKHTLLGTLVCGLAEGVTFPYVIFNMHFLIFFI